MNKKKLIIVLDNFKCHLPQECINEILKLQSPKAEEGEESKILKGFINRISKNKQLDAETQKILNETYWDLLDDNQTNRKSRTVEQIEIPTWIECSKLLTDQEKLTPLHQFIYTYGNDSRLWKNYFERAIKHLNKTK